MKKLSDKWLYEMHDKDELSSWVSSLKYFRFVRAWGGHANDGDEFVLLIKYNDFDDMKRILSDLGINLKSIPDDYPRPISGKAYTWEEYQLFKHEIMNYPGYEQPGKVTLLNRGIFIYVRNSVIEINIQDIENPYVVTAETYEYCLRLEAYLLENYSFVYSNERDGKITYISPRLYPELFK